MVSFLSLQFFGREDHWAVCLYCIRPLFSSISIWTYYPLFTPVVLFGSDHPSDFRPRFLLPLRISPSPTCLFSKKTLERKVMQLMRWSVICFNGEAPFSSRYGLPIVIRHSLTAPREALSLQILASLHLLLIVCLSGYLREKCTHLRKKKKKLTQFLIQQRKKVCHFLIVYRLWRQRDYLRENYTGRCGRRWRRWRRHNMKERKTEKDRLDFFFFFSQN